jgi:hypothetical protein
MRFAWVMLYHSVGVRPQLRRQPGQCHGTLDTRTKRVYFEQVARNSPCACEGRSCPSRGAGWRSGQDEPGTAGILDSRGLIRFRMGDYSGALADIDAARALDPKAVERYARFGIKP